MNCPIVKEITINRLEYQRFNNYFYELQEVSVDWVWGVVQHCPVPVYSDVPPWSNLGRAIKMDFHGCDTVGNLNNVECVQLFNDLSRQIYNEYVHIYTDGTKTADNTGASIVIPSRNIRQTFKLHPQMSILIAEMYGIEKALTWLEVESFDKYVIWTDSLNSLSLINSRHPESCRELTFRIQGRLRAYNQQRSVRLQWLPAHKGIPGNEEADRLAKRSSENITSERVRIPLSDRIQMVKRSAKVKFKEKLRVALEVNGIGRFAYQIKEKVENWEHANHKSRTLETVLTRLRMGHVAPGNHLFRFQMAASPLCRCGQVETVEHFLLHCTMYARQRQILFSSIQSIGSNIAVDMRLLLGGSDPNQVTQKKKKIVSSMHRFLLATGRIKML